MKLLQSKNSDKVEKIKAPRNNLQKEGMRMGPLINIIESKIYKHIQSTQEDNFLVLLITARCPYDFNCMSDSSICGLPPTEECPSLTILKIKRLFREVIRDEQ